MDTHSLCKSFLKDPGFGMKVVTLYRCCVEFLVYIIVKYLLTQSHGENKLT